MNKINVTKKGYRKEKRCADELKALGYIVWKSIRTKYCNIDLWELFDVVALHPEGDHILFIQVKSNRCDTASRDKIRDLKMPPGAHKWIWIWKDQKGWIKEFYE
jgi:hypothetical protein